MDRHFDYRPRWTIILLCVLFFGAGAAFMGAKAAGNDRGLILNGILELSPAGATIFYWVISALCLAFVALAAVMAVVRLMIPQRITLSEKSITVPRSRWSSEEVVIPYATISECNLSEVSGQRFVKIVHPGGTVTLTASMLPRNEDFDEICSALRQAAR